MQISSLVQFTLGLAIDELYKASHGSEPQRRIREAMRHLDIALSRIENPGPNDGPKPAEGEGEIYTCQACGCLWRQSDYGLALFDEKQKSCALCLNQPGVALVPKPIETNDPSTE